jgi:rare lipoprotein A (peptidoglycan hydrolase)
VQLGCCLTLVIVPLLLLATPQHAMLHGSRHHTGAVRGRVDAALTGLSTSWTTPAGFAHVVDVASRTEVSATEVAAPATTGAPHTHVVNVSFRPVLPTTTTTTVPPPAVAPKKASAASAAIVSVSKPPAPAPKPVTPAPPVWAQHVVTGLASWYGAPAGTCASPTLAFGTVVTVTDLRTGASVRCRVDDREAHNPGRVIDLAPATFSQLASLVAGVFEVRLSW